jgi:hypothetical protein
MSDHEPLDRLHLLSHAQAIFPGTVIDVIHTPDEIIHIDVDGHRYTFEIGSDDDAYVFTDGNAAFTIPLMEIDWDF